ncbi:MAG TPA: replication-associated recombination protein A [Chloroflexota bacterium]|nr:replication-associated recombination protein A [Chloroflexota bacterium]
MRSLFAEDRSSEPLAARMRPRTLDEVVGQQHLVGPGRVLRRMIEADRVQSLILFGPPGTGKTSLVNVIARATNRPFVSVNAVSAGVKELRDAIARSRPGARLILHVEEVHRFTRPQVEALLEAVERATVVFIGTTTENPYLTIPPAIRSRTSIFELRPLDAADVLTVLRRALTDSERGLAGYSPVVDEDLLEELAAAVAGDVRSALNALELAVLSAPDVPDGRAVGRELLWECLRREMHTFSESDEYDLLSALQKSVRGSDPDAALFYLARMVSVRMDLPTICRRVVVMAAEDVGNAEPRATSVAVAAAQAAQMVGYPEARIPLAQAVAYLASCPKSNAAYVGLTRALEDVEAGKGLRTPAHLRDASYSGAGRLGRGLTYKYPHDYPGHWVAQQYLPDDLIGTRYYEPTANGAEREITEHLRSLRGEDPPTEDGRIDDRTG